MCCVFMFVWPLKVYFGSKCLSICLPCQRRIEISSVLFTAESLVLEQCLAHSGGSVTGDCKNRRAGRHQGEFQCGMEVL